MTCDPDRTWSKKVSFPRFGIPAMRPFGKIDHPLNIFIAGVHRPIR
jgi:hypothetical protein